MNREPIHRKFLALEFLAGNKVCVNFLGDLPDDFKSTPKS